MRNGKHLGKKYGVGNVEDKLDSFLDGLCLAKFGFDLTENKDEHNYHAVHVVALKDALLAAFEAGKREAKRDGA